MELSQRHSTEGLEVAVSGRLDSYWADHLTATLEEAVRKGSHRITLDLALVDYMSSAGIRVLVKTYTRLAAIEGRLRIANPSKMVVETLELAGTADMLLGQPGAPAEATSAPAAASLIERGGVQYSSYVESPDARLSCRIIGDAGRLHGCSFRAEDATVMSIPVHSTVVGLGAFGDGFDACSDRFGEFLATAGTAAYLPTNGSGVPDYFVSAGDSLPESTLLYGVACEGEFARLVRFEAGGDAGQVGLGELIEACLSLAETDTAGLVLVAESAGLAGAALRRSPVNGKEPRAPFDHPEIRQWLSFTSERVHAQSVVVAAGIATRRSSGALAQFVRPLGERELPVGHIHAAAFTYTPLPRGRIGLRETIAGLYEKEKLLSVLHLLRDGRPIVGVGESAFSRGACWIGPMDPAGGEPR